jgi:hypothetical protein
MLQGCPDSFGIGPSVVALLYEISNGDRDSLYQRNFQALIQYLSSTLKNDQGKLSGFWSIGDPFLIAFDVLLRTSGPNVIKDYFELIVPIIEHHLYQLELSSKENIEWEIKIFMMALLEFVLSHDSISGPLLYGFSLRLIEKSIIPNLVWKSGGKASAVRKLTSATLFSILRREGIPREILLPSIPSLLPVLKSNLDEDDSVTRELVCLCLSYIFEALPRSLDEQNANEMYPMLLRMLDDNSDNVRLASCRTLKYFMIASEDSMPSSISEYVIESIIAHLDDPDAKFVSLVFDILSDLSRIHSTSTLKVMRRSVYSCDESSTTGELYVQLKNNNS